MCEYLAWYRYPEPNGTHYLEDDLKQPDKVIEVFDYCQVGLAIITKTGWDFLMKHYGYEKLFQLDKESGWLDCSTIDEFIEWVQYYRSLED